MNTVKVIFFFIFISSIFINAQKNNLVWQGTGYANKTTTVRQINEIDWIENDGSTSYYYTQIKVENNEYTLSDKNRQGVYIYLNSNTCYYKDNNTDWVVIYYGKWINIGDNSGSQTTTNNTTTTQTSNTNNKVESTSSCQLKFSRITGMTYSFTDNREKCCFCEKSYAKYSLNSSYQKDEEILLIGELLHLHLHDATEEHKKNDIERCQKFISDNFDAISAFSFPIMFELMGIHFMDSALKGGNFGQTHRKVNKYKFENKFCTNECESKCNYYGCKSCN
jgi:hypothetical protein